MNKNIRTSTEPAKKLLSGNFWWVYKSAGSIQTQFFVYLDIMIFFEFSDINNSKMES
jgi:hypothetical protein